MGQKILPVLFALFGTLSASASVPDQAWGKAVIGQDAPMWVSEELAVVEGKLQKQYFHPDILKILERRIEGLRAKNKLGCRIYTETAGPEGAFKGKTIHAIRTNSAQLLSGRITDLKQGFFYGQAGSMVEVALDSDSIGSQKIHLFLPTADIRVEGIHLCARPSKDRATPALGASVVLALDDGFGEDKVLGRTRQGEPILHPKPNELLIAGALPKAYQGLSIDVDDVRTSLRGHGGQR